MTQDESENATANVPAPDLNGPQVTGSGNFMEKYAAEREKRLDGKGTSQYIDLIDSDKFGKFIEDPWIEPNTPINDPVPDDGHCKFVIAGAGFGGILYAVNLIKAGFKASDLVIIDPAGGFGGTWYWNRYPGLMCDVESYIYLPLLEETGYVPKRRYASGYEIQKYCDSLCTKYGLHDRTIFQSRAKSMTWDEAAKEWVVEIVKKPKGGKESLQKLRADFAMIAPGVLSNAKLPDLDGIDSFRGHMFHSARWDYNYTGGSSEKPTLTGLQGKKVAFIGTGATAVQAVPELAKFADELIIFQRTPSAVDERGNRDTDPEWFKQNVATRPGWFRERNLNFGEFLADSPNKPEMNLVDDAWTHFPSYCALIGTPKPVTMETVGEHIGALHANDYPRQERVRQRTKDIVKDPATAEGLQAWYPGWCKRPCFHDEYLQAFNLPNVKLVNTEGKGVERVTERGIEHDGKVYDADVIIWGTGFRSPLVGSNAGKANIAVIGRDGISMESLANTGDLQTLHGTSIRQFPNFFTPGPSQAAATANYTFVLDTLTSHQAYIISQAVGKAGQGKKPVIEPTQEAMDNWAMQIMMNAVKFAGMAGCTPSYLNKEGETDLITDPAQQMKAAKNAIWPNGFRDYFNIIEAWRAEGSMQGLEVSVVG